MLRITARANDIKYDTIARKYLNDDNVFVQEGDVFTDGDSIKVPVSKWTEYSIGSTIYFERKDGSDIDWSAVTFVNTISDGFYFANMLSDVRIDYDSAELKEISIKPGETASQALVLHLKREHDYIKNRDDVFVIGRIGCSMGDIQIEDSEYGCAGDYLVYNNNFLYKVKRVSASGKYAMSSADLQNYVTTVWYEDNGEKVLFNAVVPCTLGGKDVRDTIILFGGAELLGKIAESPFSYTFYGRDRRFFTYGGERLELTNNTKISWRVGDIMAPIPMIDDFATDGLQEDSISQFIEEASNLYVNKIVDYEKQQFVPVYGEKDVSKLSFTVTVRERDDNWNADSDSGWYSDSSIWRLGFDGDDVYYRKKKVTETFLRVSIYNDVNRSKQKLLYTAKIYLNAGDLYGKYVDAIGRKTEAEVDEALDDINAEFVCTHKYDYHNSTEGFYLHLFPSNLNELDGKEGTVYMKCELNNAKYGVTVPLVWKKRSGYIMSYEESGNTLYKVDMESLRDDMYMPIAIRKDEESNRYVWEFADDVENEIYCDDEASISIELTEPRINYEMQ